MDTSGSFTSGGMSEPRAFLDGCEKFVPTGIRSLDSPNLSQLMYLLRYHDPPISMAQQPLGCPGTTATTVPRHNSHYGAQTQQPLRCPSLLFIEASSLLSDTPSRQDSCELVISPTQRPLPDNTQHSRETDIHVPGTIRANEKLQTHALNSAFAGGRLTKRTRNKILLILTCTAVNKQRIVTLGIGK